MTPLLTYTPPLQRDLTAPYKRGFFLTLPGECDRLEEIQLIRRNEIEEAPPYLEVCTAPLKAWRANDEEDFTTTIYFQTREEWQAAYRIARQIRRRRSADIFISGEDCRDLLLIDVAPMHRVKLITDWKYL